MSLEKDPHWAGRYKRAEGGVERKQEHHGKGIVIFANHTSMELTTRPPFSAGRSLRGRIQHHQADEIDIPKLSNDTETRPVDLDRILSTFKQCKMLSLKV